MTFRMLLLQERMRKCLSCLVRRKTSPESVLKSLVVLTLTLLTLTLSYVSSRVAEMGDETEEFGRLNGFVRPSPSLRVNMPELPRRVRNQLTAFRVFMDDGRFEYDDWPAFVELIDRESSWREDAKNPRSTARGLPQAMGSLNPETMTDEWLSDPAAQVKWGLDYIYNRPQYRDPKTGAGTVRNALRHHDERGWY